MSKMCPARNPENSKKFHENVKCIGYITFLYIMAVFQGYGHSNFFIYYYFFLLKLKQKKSVPVSWKMYSCNRIKFFGLLDVVPELNFE